MEANDKLDPTTVKKASVLIVDDMPNNIQLLGKILSDHNYDVLVATSGKQALFTLERKAADLILLDIMMPEMDGFEVCKKIKAHPEWADIPVLFLSAKGETEDKVRGFEVGGSDYITKPFEGVEVLARVQMQVKLKNALDTIKNYNEQLEVILAQRTKALVRAERQAAISLSLKGIVHNLSNPLGIILGNAELIQMEKTIINSASNQSLAESHPEIAASLEDIWDYAEGVESCSLTLRDMIDSLMIRSRIDRKDQSEPVDLNQIIAQEIKYLDSDRQFKHNVEKNIHLAEGELTTQIVSLEIAQVCQNLIRNALDAMSEQADASLSIESSAKGDLVWFSVADNGPGIEEENLPHIFDPFFTTKSEVGSGSGEGPTGTGLGLHVSAEIVESYNGKIELDNEVGKGAKFTVLLPRFETQNSAD
jgi:two-component system NtrC family sensor kinase